MRVVDEIAQIVFDRHAVRPIEPQVLVSFGRNRTTPTPTNGRVLQKTARFTTRLILAERCSEKHPAPERPILKLATLWAKRAKGQARPAIPQRHRHPLGMHKTGYTNREIARKYRIKSPVISQAPCQWSDPVEKRPARLMMPACFGTRPNNAKRRTPMQMTKWNCRLGNTLQASIAGRLLMRGRC